MSRLIAVSNRVGPIRGAPQAGGLSVALVDALRDREGLWFGWSGKLAAHPKPGLTHDSHEGVHTATVDLPASEYEGYYNGFANGCLWPLFHSRPDLVHYRSDDYQAYLAVNTRLAQRLAPLLKEDDLIWIHDFHLIPLAQALRDLGCKQRLGFFLHVPFPSRDLLITLPQHIALLRMLSAYDLVGVQTSVHLEQLQNCLQLVPGATSLPEGSEGWQLDGHTTRAGVYPVGIDVETFQGFATTTRARHISQRLQDSLRHRLQIIGVDRLDYSKGLLRRVEAYERFLEHYPRAHGRVDYLQIAPVSRGEVSAYQAFRQELELAAARVNGRYSRYDWTPLRYLNSALRRQTLAALYRASRIGLVTPLRDGMNLVAKEYVAAQDPDDPGVLVLSQFAGAAQQMTAAVIANPYDAEAVAKALEQARVMPLTERRERHAELLAGLKEWDTRRWHREYLTQLAAS